MTPSARLMSPYGSPRSQIYPSLSSQFHLSRSQESDILQLYDSNPMSDNMTSTTRTTDSNKSSALVTGNGLTLSLIPPGEVQVCLSSPISPSTSTPLTQRNIIKHSNSSSTAAADRSPVDLVAELDKVVHEEDDLNEPTQDYLLNKLNRRRERRRKKKALMKTSSAKVDAPPAISKVNDNVSPLPAEKQGKEETVV